MDGDAVFPLLIVRFHLLRGRVWNKKIAFHVTYPTITATACPTLQLVQLGSMNPAKFLNRSQIGGGLGFYKTWRECL